MPISPNICYLLLAKGRIWISNHASLFVYTDTVRRTIFDIRKTKRWETTTCSFFLKIFFFLSPTSVYLTMVGVEGYFSLDHIQGHATVGRTPLDEGSARRRDPYETTHNIYNTHVPGGIRTRNPSRRLDRSATGIFSLKYYFYSHRRSFPSINIIITYKVNSYLI